MASSSCQAYSSAGQGDERLADSRSGKLGQFAIARAAHRATSRSASIARASSAPGRPRPPLRPCPGPRTGVALDTALPGVSQQVGHGIGGGWADRPRARARVIAHEDFRVGEGGAWPRARPCGPAWSARKPAAPAHLGELVRQGMHSGPMASLLFKSPSPARSSGERRGRHRPSAHEVLAASPLAPMRASSSAACRRTDQSESVSDLLIAAVSVTFFGPQSRMPLAACSRTPGEGSSSAATSAGTASAATFFIRRMQRTACSRT